MNSKYYDNGEIIIKSRMEDEDWYSDYQDLLELTITDKPISIDELLYEFDKDRIEIFGIKYKNSEQLLRWCTFLVERQKNTLIYLKKEKTNDN